MEKAPGKKITVTADGPYKVEGGVEINDLDIGSDANGDSISWVKGKTYPRADPSKTVFLCRCGHTGNPPFCDGSHKKVGFHGREQPEKKTYSERAEVQGGKGVTLLDDPSLCIGARFCDVGKTVWYYAEDADNPEDRDMVIRESCGCPSGRLTVIDENGRTVEPELSPAVSVIQDPINDCRGPLWVQGGIQVEGPNGEEYEVRNRVTLCRCGESHNQPFCDASHYECTHMKGAEK